MGLCEFKVLPFGLIIVEATLQKLINHVLTAPTDFACVYIDGIAIFCGS